MSYEAVLYSHYSMTNHATISSFALLYDRVILPLADWACSDAPLAKEMAQHCPAIQRLLQDTAPLRNGKYPLLLPLCAQDTSLAHCSETFGTAFTRYLIHHNLNWDQICKDDSLGQAFGLIHQFIGNVLVAEDPMRRVPVHYSGHDALSDNTIFGLANYLGASVADYVIPRLLVDPSRLDTVREIVRHDKHRQDFLSAMLTFGERCHDAVAKASTDREKRDVVRVHAEQLRASWNQWYRALSTLERHGWIRVLAGRGDNLIVVLASAVSIKLKKSGGVTIPPFQGALEQERNSIAHDLLGKQLIEIAEEKVTWQRHLLAVKLEMEELYGERRGFNASSRASEGPTVQVKPALTQRAWNGVKGLFRRRD